MSAPCHLACPHHWVFSPKWHFCNYEWQGDIFVNTNNCGDVTTFLGILLHGQPPSYPPFSIFTLLSLVGDPWRCLFRFSHFSTRF